jgi:hypothetical protein
MKKTVCSLMVATLLSQTAFAAVPNTDHAQMINNSLDQFRYSMTVEADAGTAEGQARAVAQLMKQLQTLQSEGVSAQELLNHLRASLLDESTRADFDRILGAIDPASMPAEEAAGLVMRFLDGKYQQGANFTGNGGYNYWRIGGIVLAVVVVYYFYHGDLPFMDSSDKPNKPKKNFLDSLFPGKGKGLFK